MKLKIKNWDPQTENQEKAVLEWEEGNNLVLLGPQGTGKTFLGMALGLAQAEDQNKDFMIIRSTVPARDVGFLKGTFEEKIEPYTKPYKKIVNCDLYENNNAWALLEKANKIEFDVTSFLRGDNFYNKVVYVDEIQNMSFVELETILTRGDDNTDYIFSGDLEGQQDLGWKEDKDGAREFCNILQSMTFFETIQFGWEDVVRSDMVREYLMARAHYRQQKAKS